MIIPRGNGRTDGGGGGQNLLLNCTLHSPSRDRPQRLRRSRAPYCSAPLLLPRSLMLSSLHSTCTAPSTTRASERSREGGSCGSRDKLSARRRDGARRRARALPCNDSSRNNSTIRTRPSIHPSSGRAAESPLQRCCSASRDSGDRENPGSLLP